MQRLWQCAGTTLLSPPVPLLCSFRFLSSHPFRFLPVYPPPNPARFDLHSHWWRISANPDWQAKVSTCPFARLWYPTKIWGHDILKMREPMLMPTGTSGPRVKGIKMVNFGSQEVKAQGQTSPLSGGGIIPDPLRLGTFLGERYYVTFALWHEPSVCRLSVCRL